MIREDSHVCEDTRSLAVYIHVYVNEHCELFDP